MNLTPLQARVARDIVAYVRQEQLAAGHHVSELGLAKALKTSRTPIKIALNYLAERGMLSQDRNRGFSWPSPMTIWLKLPRICRSPSTIRSINRSR
ncbi:GntR family transcriptional regulator [Pseudomonas juntendi]|nr:GntR family transcriptional regulator [Pseudomonas juntendi]